MNGRVRELFWYMAGAGRKAFAPVFLLVLSAAIPAFADDVENVCITCHTELEGELKAAADEWRESAHAAAGVMCNDCHGGDPADIAMAMDPSKGWKPRPKPVEVAGMCARCHNDPLRMRQYNLRTDQHDLYTGSVHGKKLIGAKDQESPSCTSCHGKHEIRKVDDPKSSVNRKNVVKTCANCHSSQKVMEKRHIPWNQYELYKGSVHGAAYFERGDQGVPTCVNCHGNHGIQKPQNITTRLVCADCHVEQTEAYKKSRHWIAAQDQGKPLCIHCHSNHGIAKATEAKLSEPGELNCLGCHGKNSPQMDGAAALFTALTAARDDLARARESLKAMEEWSGSGFETSHLKAGIAKAETIYKAMRVESHTLDEQRLAADAENVKQISAGITTEVDRMMAELRKRKIGLAATWLVAILFSGAIWQRARYCKRD